MKYTYKDDILKISLDKTYQKNQDYTVYIKYVARPNEVKQKVLPRLMMQKVFILLMLKEKTLINLPKSGLKVKPKSSSCWFPTIDKPNKKQLKKFILLFLNNMLRFLTVYLERFSEFRRKFENRPFVMDKNISVFIFMGIMIMLW